MGYTDSGYVLDYDVLVPSPYGLKTGQFVYDDVDTGYTHSAFFVNGSIVHLNSGTSLVASSPVIGDKQYFADLNAIQNIAQLYGLETYGAPIMTRSYTDDPGEGGGDCITTDFRYSRTGDGPVQDEPGSTGVFRYDDGTNVHVGWYWNGQNVGEQPLNTEPYNSITAADGTVYNKGTQQSYAGKSHTTGWSIQMTTCGGGGGGGGCTTNCNPVPPILPKPPGLDDDPDLIKCSQDEIEDFKNSDNYRESFGDFCRTDIY